jgi:hypothetical protein
MVQCIGCTGTCLPSRCLAPKSLPYNDRRDTYRHTDWWKGFMKYAVEMGSVVMTYILSFIKIGSGIQQ